MARRWRKGALRSGGRRGLGAVRGCVLAAALTGIALTGTAEVQGLVRWWLDAALWGFVGLLWAHWAIHLHAALKRGVDAAKAYLRSPASVVDALAALAVPAAFAAGAGAPQAWLAGAVWVLKLVPSSPGLAHLARTVVNEAGPLRSLGVLFLTVLVLSAAAMTATERHTAEAFGSLPSALWWVLVALTTNSYPEGLVPQTALGRAVGTAVMLFGLGLFGLLTGILATGFAAEGRRRDFLRAWELVARVPFLEPLGPGGSAELAHCLRRWDVPEGTTVVRRGRVADCMYLIAAGEVEVDLERGAKRLGKGDFFGEMAILGGDGARRTADVTTTRPSTLLILDVADFRPLAARYPALAVAVEATAARRVAELLAEGVAAKNPDPLGRRGSDGDAG